MANSKHAHLRYNILDYCFRYKALSSEQLLEYVNDKIIELYPGETIYSELDTNIHFATVQGMVQRLDKVFKNETKNIIIQLNKYLYA